MRFTLLFIAVLVAPVAVAITPLEYAIQLNPKLKDARDTEKAMVDASIQKDVLPSDRPLCQRYVDAIHKNGVMSLSIREVGKVYQNHREIVPYLFRSLAIEILPYSFDHPLTAESREAIRGLQISEEWRTAMEATELLGLDQVGCVHFALSDDKRSLLYARRPSIPDLAAREFPILKNRCLDLADGSHTRTRERSLAARGKEAEVKEFRENDIMAEAHQLLFQESSHRWTDSTLKHHVEAVFVSLKKGTVTLRKQDDKTVSMNLSKLCHKDRELIRRIIIAAKKNNVPATMDLKNSGIGVTHQMLK